MNPFNIFLILFAFGLAVYVAYTLGYIKGHGVGYEKRVTDKVIDQWLKSFKSKNKEKIK